MNDEQPANDTGPEDSGAMVLDLSEPGALTRDAAGMEPGRSTRGVSSRDNNGRPLDVTILLPEDRELRQGADLVGFDGPNSEAPPEVVSVSRLSLDPSEAISMIEETSAQVGYPAPEVEDLVRRVQEMSSDTDAIATEDAFIERQVGDLWTTLEARVSPPSEGGDITLIHTFWFDDPVGANGADPL